MLFPYAHATHPDWRMAASLVVAQLRAQMEQPAHAPTPERPTSLGLLYITDHYTDAAHEILDFLSAELAQVTDWAGTVGVGIAVHNAEYFDEPALAVMLCALPPDSYRVFSGVAPLGGFKANTVLVHADGHTPDLSDLIEELAQRTRSGYVFGGLASSRQQAVQFAFSSRGAVAGQGAQQGVLRGGLSGVAFGDSVAWLSRVTQGCTPVAAARVIGEAERNVVYELDGEGALDRLFTDLEVSLDEPEWAMARLRETMVAISGNDAEAGALGARRGQLPEESRVRHIIGLDPQRRGVAVADFVNSGDRLQFCRRDRVAARADLMRICAEVREALEPQPIGDDAEPGPDAVARRIAGAVYVSCAGRGGPHFGAPSAEMQLVRHALGDVPLVGFFAGGEIAHRHVYGYSGVLTVFLDD
jgi:small ligand-binding sensory domain FIST